MRGVRVYVGRLPADATQADLQDRFQRVLPANVSMVTVDLMRNSSATDFAYLELKSNTDNADDEYAAVQAVVQAYHNTKWKGKRLRVEPAHPDYLARLAYEWEATAAHKEAIAAARVPSHATVEPAATELNLKPSKRFKGSKVTFDDDGHGTVVVQAIVAAARATKKVAPVMTNAAIESDPEDDDDRSVYIRHFR
ncbi:hypothetical protein DYB25_009558 [Aphanomyces astaci]|uniref:RRM domain-containing protein n=1 Tax=Aphanomyces astaci TaxID=112090 RepID=A0A397AZB2_APHAT|nr:hypothetical protein DYB25_009558 [Aphanomyces astaci]RHY74712.1 hypothetical protein DYB34_013770 [Aphanomyces astaci]RHZ07362.1 hypothetical protein DYB26_013243 [Aphanomyces astaci]